MAANRGRAVTIPLWKPTAINVANGSNYWANFVTHGISANSAAVPADLSYWATIPVESYRYATLTFYSRIAAITTDTGTDGHIGTAVLKGMVHRGGAGTTLPTKPPEVGLSWATGSDLHLRNTVGMIRANPNNRATPAAPYGNSYMFGPSAHCVDFLARSGVAAAVDQEEMEHLYVVPIRMSEELLTTDKLSIGSGFDLTPLASLFFAFRVGAGRTSNITLHADTGIYITLER